MRHPLTNHDQPRVMTVLGDPVKARVAASAMLMLPGMPFVYYGEEIGMVGPKPDELIRTPMQWSSAPNGGFTTGTPWEPLQPDWVTKNVAGQNADSTSLLNHYRRLIQLRNAHPAFTSGSLSMVQTGDTSGTIAAWLRATNKETFLIVVNFGARHETLYTGRLSINVPEAWGSYRLVRAYNDPPVACRGSLIFDTARMVVISSIAAQSLCVLQILPRR